MRELARQSPRVKDTDLFHQALKQRKQVGRDIFEVLLTKHGQILEGMTSNFYAIKGKTLVTAQDGILLGVTRHVILGLARGEGMSIEYRAPIVNEKFDEAFLTSSSRGVVPIISIDNKSVGQGRVGKWTQMLSKAYQAYVEERSEDIVGVRRFLIHCSFQLFLEDFVVGFIEFIIGQVCISLRDLNICMPRKFLCISKISSTAQYGCDKIMTEGMRGDLADHLFA